MESGNRDLRIALTADLIRSPYAREGALALLQAADLGIADVERFQPELEPEMVDRIARALRILNEPEDDTDASNKSFVYSEVIRLLHVGRDGAEAIDAGTGVARHAGVARLGGPGASSPSRRNSRSD